MGINIDQLRKKSKKSFEAITKKFDKTASYGEKDPRYWTIKPGKDGNAAAIIRFLGSSGNDTTDEPIVTMYKYSFENKGKWYIENSLQTIGKEDPVYKLNGELYQKADGDKDSPYVKQAKRQGRQIKYHTNIRVIKDPQNPENDGKVFLFEFGPQIYKKIQNIMFPTDVEKALDTKPVDVFDYENGVNFRLKVTTKMVNFGKGEKPTPNYEGSAFDSTPSPVADSVEEMLDIANNQTYSLGELIDEKNFKSYEILEKKLNWVLSDAKASSKTEDAGDGDEENSTAEDQHTAPEPAKTSSAPNGSAEEAADYLKSLMMS